MTITFFSSKTNFINQPKFASSKSTKSTPSKVSEAVAISMGKRSQHHAVNVVGGFTRGFAHYAAGISLLLASLFVPSTAMVAATGIKAASLIQVLGMAANGMGSLFNGSAFVNLFQAKAAYDISKGTAADAEASEPALFAPRKLKQTDLGKA